MAVVVEKQSFGRNYYIVAAVVAAAGFAEAVVEYNHRIGYWLSFDNCSRSCSCPGHNYSRSRCHSRSLARVMRFWT